MVKIHPEMRKIKKPIFLQQLEDIKHRAIQENRAVLDYAAELMKSVVVQNVP